MNGFLATGVRQLWLAFGDDYVNADLASRFTPVN